MENKDCSKHEFHELAWHISEIAQGSKSVYLRTDPDVPDFTSKSVFKIFVFGARSKVELEVTPGNVASVVALFDVTIFDPELVERLYVWKLKSLASYLRFFTDRFLSPKVAVIDLSLIENFQNIHKKPPENLVEAINRTKLAVQCKTWKSLYKSIHLPLALRVLPTVETTPLLDERSRKCVYPYYEIEGQANGRFNSVKKFDYGYLPHNLGPDQRCVLKPLGESMRFASADFRHCEVTVLQWLSKDERLSEMLDRGEDLHSKIYEVITEDTCNTPKKRQLSQLMFLPVMYGCRPKTLAENLGVKETIAEVLFNRIRLRFSTAWRWMEERQEEAKHGESSDYFGRPRKYPDKPYLARNAAVQGVAATVCQEKLIDLWSAVDGDRVKILFSVHDGFVLACKTAAAKDTFLLVKRVLESESKLCPGLKMKIEVKFGAKLNDMKVFWC